MIHRSYRKSALLEAHSPPPQLQGRAGAVVVRQGMQYFKAIVLYMPIRGTAASARSLYKRTADGLFAWLKEELQSTPVRCTPFITIDLSDGLGLVDKVYC